MPRIRSQVLDLEIETDTTTTIPQASLKAEFPHTHVCGGSASCSTCRVSIPNGLERCAPRNAEAQALAERLGLSPAIRLACQTTLTGDVILKHLVLDAEDVEITDQESSGSAAGPVGRER